MNSKSENVKVIRASTIKMEGECMPVRIVLWQDLSYKRIGEGDKSFATSIELMPWGRQSSFVLGHCNMDFWKARGDYMSRCLVENCEWFNKDEVSIKLHELSYQQATAMLLRIHDAGHFRDMEVMAMNKLFESVENMEERRVA